MFIKHQNKLWVGKPPLENMVTVLRSCKPMMPH